MAGNASYDMLLSTTIKKHTPKFTDNFFKNNFLLDWLMRNAKVEVEGGAKIVEPVLYDDNDTVQSFSPYGTIDISPQQGHSAAEYDWKFVSGTVAISDPEEALNSGPLAVIKILKSKVKQLDLSMRDKFNFYFFSDGTGNGSLDPHGLQQLVSVTNNTVGGIDSSQADNSWWRPTRLDATADGNAIRNDSEWTNVINTASKGGNDRPNVGITTQTIFEHYEASLAPLLRITSNDEADARFNHLFFKNIRLGWDSYCLSGATYWLNSEYMMLKTHSKRWFYNTDFKDAPDVVAKWSQVLCYCNLVVNNRERHALNYGQTVS
jgi:hypothetical protein